MKSGETKTVTFTIGFDELKILNQEMKKVVESDKFKVSVGASSLEKDLQRAIFNFFTIN